MKDMKQAVGQILHGKLDIAWDMRKQEADWLEERIGIRKIPGITTMATFAIFNTRSPKLADKRVRQALNLSIDRAAIARASSHTKAHTFAVPSMMSQANKELGPLHDGLTYKQRLEKARTLLSEAGYGPQNPLKLSIITIPRETFKDNSIALRSMFSQIGIDVKLDVLQIDEFVPRVLSKNYEVSLAEWRADYDDAMTFYGLLQSDATKNHSAMSNPRYDELVAMALKEQDAAKRQKIYAQLETILRDESPIAPLAHGNFTMIASPRMKQAVLTPWCFSAFLPWSFINPVWESDSWYGFPSIAKRASSNSGKTSQFSTIAFSSRRSMAIGLGSTGFQGFSKMRVAFYGPPCTGTTT